VLLAATNIPDHDPFNVNPFLFQQVARNDLGSRANEELLDKLIPKYWFSAHLHVKFPALVNHDAWVNRFARKVPGPAGPQSGGQEIKVDNPDEIVISMDDDDDDVLETPSVNLNETPVNMDTPTSNAASEPVIAASNPDEIVMDDDDFDEPATTSIINVDNTESIKSEPAQSLDTSEIHDELINEITEKAPELEISNQGNSIVVWTTTKMNQFIYHVIAMKLPKLRGF
jgi:hypothetical protein